MDNKNISRENSHHLDKRTNEKVNKKNGRLVLTRRDKEDENIVNVTHIETGDTFELKLYDIRIDPRTGYAEGKLAFLDEERNFQFDRPERKIYNKPVSQQK